LGRAILNHWILWFAKIIGETQASQCNKISPGDKGRDHARGCKIGDDLNSCGPLAYPDVQSVQSMQRKYEKITSSKGVPTWITLYLWIIGNYW